jgi:hypothetical protein
MVPAPAETVALWCERAKSMGRDDLEDSERRTFAASDRDFRVPTIVAIATTKSMTRSQSLWSGTA